MKTYDATLKEGVELEVGATCDVKRQLRHSRTYGASRKISKEHVFTLGS